MSFIELAHAVEAAKEVVSEAREALFSAQNAVETLKVQQEKALAEAGQIVAKVEAAYTAAVEKLQTLFAEVAAHIGAPEPTSRATKDVDAKTLKNIYLAGQARRNQ